MPRNSSKAPAPLLSRRTFCKTMASVGAVLSGSCDSSIPSTPKQNVVLIVLDTLRADHVGCYGNGGPLTPALDAFSETATRFTKAFAPASWTLSSHASMFTGKWPYEHGADLYARPIIDREHNDKPLDEEFVTLAEAFRREGYNTGAVVANPAYLTVRYGMAQGFRAFDCRYQHAPAINLRIDHWIKENADMPFFFFANLMDCHFPFNNKPCPAVTTEPLKGTKDLIWDLRSAVLPPGARPPQQKLRLYGTRYRLGVANADKGLERILKTLKARGLFDDSLIIVTSDHGEALGEHQLIAHVMDLYEHQIRVPLLFKAPGQQQGDIDERPVSLVDVPHLIFDRLPGPMARRGCATFPRRPGNHPILADQNYTLWILLESPEYGMRFKRTRKAIIDWPYKYIESSDGRHELFDLVKDSGEKTNLMGSHPDLTARLSTELSGYLATLDGAPEPTPRDVEVRLAPDEVRELRAIGYL